MDKWMPKETMKTESICFKNLSNLTLTLLTQTPAKKVHRVTTSKNACKNAIRKACLGGNPYLRITLDNMRERHINVQKLKPFSEPLKVDSA